MALLTPSESASLEKFKKIVQAEKDLVPCVEEEFLLRFLRARDSDSEKALAVLLNYYKIRKENALIYKNFRPTAPNIKSLNEQNIFFVSPYRDELGRAVLLMRDGHRDTACSSFDDMYIAIQLCIELEIRKEETQLNGMVIVDDVGRIGWQHVKQLGPTNARKLLFLFEQALPCNFCEFHYVNTNFAFKAILQVIRSLASKELKEKIFIHSNVQELHKFVNPNVLPHEFGGREDFKFDNTEYQHSVVNAEDSLTKLNEFGYKSALSA